MNNSVEIKCEKIAKLLHIMMYLALASILNSVISMLPFVPGWVTTLISQGIVLGITICLLQLAPANPRYKKAGILRAAMLICALITSFVYTLSILTFVASILSIIAVYQEYNAHSELIAEKDAKLSGKWHSLFTWSIVAGVLVGFGSTATVVILALLEMDVVRLTSIIVGILCIPQIVIDFVYMMYLKRMIPYFAEGEVQ